MQKEPFIISKKNQDLPSAKTATSYLGKKTYSSSGDYVGTVKDLYFQDDQFIGLLVKGKHLLFIDKIYCEPETVDTLILTIDPITMLKGKLVFDASGKRLGKVTGIERSTVKNTCDHLLVKKNLFTKPRPIPYTDVDVAQKNIILDKAYNEW